MQWSVIVVTLLFFLLDGVRVFGKASTSFLRRRFFNTVKNRKFWGPLSNPYVKSNWFRKPTFGGGSSSTGFGGDNGGDWPPPPTAVSANGNDDDDRKRPVSVVTLMGWSSWTFSVAAAVAAAVDWYASALVTHPVLIKVLTSALLGICGDSICQHLERSAGKAGSWNYRRTFIFSAVAGLYLAPVTHLWFNFLNALPFLPPGRLERALIMVAVDQTVGAVTITSGLFFAVELMAMIVPPYAAGASPRFEHVATAATAAYDALRHKLGPIMKANWKLWPICNFLNFYLVPLEYRVLVVSLLQLGWNVFLSKALAAGTPAAAPGGLLAVGEGLGSPGSDGGLLEVLEVDYAGDKEDEAAT